MNSLISTKLTKDQVDAWLSSPRFAAYLRACHDSVPDALRLYEWNIDLGSVLMKDIACFEIALRNSYNKVLSEFWQKQSSEHWLFDSDSPVNLPLLRRTSRGEQFDANALNRKKIADAKPKRACHLHADRTIANLTFGFWAHMTDKAHERTLWIPAVYRAWPKGTNRSELDAKLRLINEARNRIAHHEHLFDMRDDGLLPLNVDKTVIELFHALLPDVEIFSNPGSSPVERYVRSHPMAVNVGVADGR